MLNRYVSPLTAGRKEIGRYPSGRVKQPETLIVPESEPRQSPGLVPWHPSAGILSLPANTRHSTTVMPALPANTRHSTTVMSALPANTRYSTTVMSANIRHSATVMSALPANTRHSTTAVSYTHLTLPTNHRV